MGLLRLLERRTSPENPSTSLSNPDAWLYDALGAGTNRSGVAVNETSAMRHSAVYACIRILAESIAVLPTVVHERLKRGKRVAIDHPLYPLLHDEPNPEIPAFTFKETLQAHAAGWGNAFAEIEWGSDGRVRALWPLLPDRTRAIRHNGRRLVITRLLDGSEAALKAENVLHIPGLGFDGVSGYSVIQLAKQSIGLAMATEEYGAAYFSNGAKPAGVLEHPNRLKDDAHKRLRESWNEIHQGLSNAHRVAILEEGMKWHQLSIPNEDAQFLETRKFQVTEIARWFRIPPHMIADLERSTNNNIEHQGLEFVTHTLMSWINRWEQWLNRSLLLPSERRQFYVKMNAAALLRGDSAGRAAYYKARFDVGSISQNEIRELEDENPIEGGDVYFVPLNMVPSDLAASLAKEKTKPQPASRADHARVANAFRRVFHRQADELIRRQAAAVRAAVRKHGNDLQQLRIAIDEFFAGEQDVVSRSITPIREALADAAALEAVDAASMVDQAINAPLAQLRACLREPEGALARIQALLITWEEGRAAAWADAEVAAAIIQQPAIAA